MPGIFDAKMFNAEIFEGYRQSIPDPVINALLESGAVVEDTALGARFTEDGGNYAIEAMDAPLTGTADNYDGVSNINLDSQDTYVQGKIVIGRAHGWQEKDFAEDITRVDWMERIARKMNAYFAGVHMRDIYATLTGIFKITAGSFSTKHTYDITGTGTGEIGITSLNDGTQAAMGDHKSMIQLALMDSLMATKLENLGLLNFVQGTDKDGLKRDTTMATWGGRTVLVSDGVPMATGAAGGADKAHQIILLGSGAIRHGKAPVKVPNEMGRNALTNGGLNYLVGRTRDLWVPSGIHFTNKSVATLSPTVAELEAAANWTLVTDGSASSTKYIDPKLVPIGRILALG